MAYIVDAIGEIFSPSEATIRSRREAEERRRDALGWRGRLKEDLREAALRTVWLTVCACALSVTFGPWFYGVWKLVEAFR